MDKSVEPTDFASPIGHAVYSSLDDLFVGTHLNQNGILIGIRIRNLSALLNVDKRLVVLSAEEVVVVREDFRDL